MSSTVASSPNSTPNQTVNTAVPPSATRVAAPAPAAIDAAERGSLTGIGISPQPAARKAAKPKSAIAGSPPDSIWVGVTFWAVLFLSAALFGLVTLSPKWQRAELLRDRIASLSAETDRLAESNVKFEQLLEAFRHDPEFDRKLARLELDYVEAGEDRLTISDTPTSPQPAAIVSHAASPRTGAWWSPCLQLFASDPSVRRAALVTAAILLVVSLACFNSAREE